MNIELPDNIQDEKGYLGHIFSKLEALCDIQILALRGIELSVRKLALRWGWEQTKVHRFLKSSATLLQQERNTSICENQEVTQESATEVQHFCNNLLHSKEKETTPPNNNIIITPIKEKERKENIIIKEKEKERAILAGKNIPPTIEQIKDYLAKRGFTDVDAELFWNFYNSKGWKVGKERMVNWHSAVATWRKQRQSNNYNYANNRTTGNGQQFANAQEREDWLISRLSRKYKGVLDE